MDIDSAVFEKLRHYASNCLLGEVVAAKTFMTLLDIFKALEMEKKIELGNYSFIINMLEQCGINREDIVMDIKTCSDEIQKLLKASKSYRESSRSSMKDVANGKSL